MSNLYDEDVIASAEQQARLLRLRQWSQLDIDNIAEEIADVGKSEKRELQSRNVRADGAFVEVGLSAGPARA